MIEIPTKTFARPGSSLSGAAFRLDNFPNETRAAAHLLFLTGWEPWRVANALSVGSGTARRWKEEADAAFAAVLQDGAPVRSAGR